ncbi:MAG: hypothetical protein IPQ13_00635 [Holophagaceae bacterium]|nr:hypothetical protein [Holophagaceae bacterium]
MSAPTKKLGELLVEAGLLTPVQLSETLRHQRFHGGRMGGNLVSLGFISEDMLMDFLAQQTGVPRLEGKALEHIRPEVLKRIPQRMAEQLTILPIEFKEPKSLILAMADPSDLNAIDSARFASGLSIEPLVASHSMLRAAIAEQYRKADPVPETTFEVGRSFSSEDALPVSFDLPAIQFTPSREPNKSNATGSFGRDPFFDAVPEARHLPAEEPLGVFAPTDPFDPFAVPSFDITDAPGLRGTQPSIKPTVDGSLIIHDRVAAPSSIKKVDSYGTRQLILGLVKTLQRHGVVGDEEIQRTIQGMIETGEIKPE